MNDVSAFFRSVTLTDLTLRVGDLGAVSAFYRDRIGFRVIAQERDRVAMSATGRAPALLVLEAAPDARRRPAGSAGLFHAAYLLPDRPSLGHLARTLADNHVLFSSANHGVSEALYLQDPEGNGIELYADRTVDAWPEATAVDQVAMFTAPLNVGALIAAARAPASGLLPEDIRLGHVHLSVSALDAARTFYAGVLGFPVRQQDYPGALFFGRDGYHHHLAANTWRSQRPVAPDARGLLRFNLHLKDSTEREQVLERARNAKVLCAGDADRTVLRDTDGIEVVVTA